MKKYQSEISKVIYQDAKAMHRAGIISDERMREYDEMCLVKPAASATRVSSQKPAGGMRSGTPAFARGK